MVSARWRLRAQIASLSFLGRSWFGLDPAHGTVDLSGSAKSFGFPDRAHDQPVAGNPGGIPAFEGRTAHRAFVAAALSGRSDGFDAAIDRAACAGSVVGFWHPSNMRPGVSFCQSLCFAKASCCCQSACNGRGEGRVTTIGCNVQYNCPRFLYLPEKPYKLAAFD